MRARKFFKRSNKGQLPILFSIELGIGIMLLYYTIVLPPNPGSFFLDIRFFSLTIFASIFVVKLFEVTKKIKLWRILETLILILSLSTSLFLSYPTPKLSVDAVRETEQGQEAVSLGIELGELIKENTISEQEAREQIQEQFPEQTEPQSWAQAVMESVAMATDSNEEEITAAIFPTVPVGSEKWLCNNLGCGAEFGTEIWTSSYRVKTLATIVNGISIGLLIIVSRTEKKAKNKNKDKDKDKHKHKHKA